MTHAPPVPTLSPAFDVVVQLGPMADHGLTRAGHRRVIPIVGGRISGAFDAEILPGGADWQLVRADGAIEIDGRYTARTHDGELLYLQVTGVRTGSPDVLAALLRGDDVAPDRYYFRTVVTIETASTRLAHLEHSVFVASCVRDADAVRYAAYRVT
ncbi:DUF3237 domain-containing protein [Agromyces sp. NPDC049794]|uniref:DUF3237 domain-containing protein n=1 Tax=unclassified Agromyces TaxID=2639701 RepID=UPI0033D7A4C7